MTIHLDASVRRDQILNAATLCIASVGFERATMDAIASSAGVSKGSVYWHFKNKASILDALIDQVTEDLLETWQIDAGTDVGAFVLERGEATLRGFAANRFLLETWIELLHHPDARQRIREMYQNMRQKLAKNLGQNGKKKSAAIIALLEGLLLQATIDPDFNPLPIWRSHANNLV